MVIADERRALVYVILAWSVFLLSGCGSRVSNNEGGPLDYSQETESARLKQCQEELEALNTVAPADYTKYRKEFDRLMNGAAQYAGLRDTVGNGTRNTVDALYHYKVNLLCADVSQAMLKGLTERGERS
ncbi:hypothetical protein ACX43S_25295 [Enterobacter cloacae]